MQVVNHGQTIESVKNPSTVDHHKPHTSYPSTFEFLHSSRRQLGQFQAQGLRPFSEICIHIYLCVYICELTSTWVKTPLLFKHQNFVTQLISHWIMALKVLSKKMWKLRAPTKENVLRLLLQCDAVCCSVLLCVAVCCRVLQCVAGVAVFCNKGSNKDQLVCFRLIYIPSLLMVIFIHQLKYLQKHCEGLSDFCPADGTQ